MTMHGNDSKPPAEFELLYEKLRTPEAEAVVKADKVIRREATAAQEIAETLEGPTSWPPFMTYVSG